MRKRVLTLLAATLLLPSGCSHHEQPSPKEGAPERFSATVTDVTAPSGAAMRTAMDPLSGLLWQAGDALSVFAGTDANLRYELTDGAGGKEAVFTLKPGVSPTEHFTLEANFAVYPYASETTISEEGVIRYTLPEVQSYAENSFSAGAFPMVAVTGSSLENELHFKNLCGALLFSLTGEARIRQIELRGNDGEPLCGTMTILASNDGQPQGTMAETSGEVLRLDCGEGVQLSDEPTAFWIVVPPTRFEKGFSLLITDTDGGNMPKVLEKDLTVERNVIQPMEAFAYEALEPEPDSYEATLEALEGFGTLAWAENAGIRVFPEGGAQEGLLIPFAQSLLPDGSSAAFLSEDFSGYGQACLALYPGAGALREADALTFTLPQERLCAGKDFDTSTLPVAARKGAGARLDFRHLCNVIAVRYESARPLKEIRLRSKKDEALWGSARVSFRETDGLPVLAMDENPSETRNSLVINLSKEGNTGAGTEFFTTGSHSSVTGGTLDGNAGDNGGCVYFVVPAGTLQEGFTVTFLDEGFGYMQAEGAALAQERAFCREEERRTYRSAADDIEVRTDVLNKAFYKDIFMDSGIRLSSFTSMPVTNFLGISLEYYKGEHDSDKVTDEEVEAQREVFVGTDDDRNGRILYPDGEPRYRMVYVNGGGSADHGYSLDSDGRMRYRQFVYNGGAYLGSCAGAYLVTAGDDLNQNVTATYLGLWPSHCNRLATKQIYTGHVLPEDSPLLQYYDFGGDFYVDSVRHHNGPCFIDYATVPGTEVLTRFNMPDSANMHGHPAIIAWKEDKWKGRIIPCGSHPEQVGHNENLILMAALVRYSLDGVGIAKVKGILHNGETRPMTCATEEEKPAFTRIGDRQCHHFVFSLPAGARNVKVRLEAKEDYDLSLMLARETFAFEEDAAYRKAGSDRIKELSFPSLEAGVWYVGVQCESTVTVTDEHGEHGTTYGNTGVLNGVPYTIGVSWDY